MPNWCEGYLKIRGKKKDLINFIENEFVIAKSESVISGIEYIDVKMEDDGLGECRFEHESSYLKKLKLKNTRRFFVGRLHGMDYDYKVIGNIYENKELLDEME